MEPQISNNEQMKVLQKLIDWTHTHQEDDSRVFKEILEKLDKLEKKIEPIVETYNAVGLLGKWITAAVVFVSIVASIYFGYKGLNK